MIKKHKTKKHIFMRIIPYDVMVKIADIRNKYRWRKRKGETELSWFTWLASEIRVYIRYIVYLSGASLGLKLFPFLPPGLIDQFPWIGEKVIWLSDSLTKKVIIYIMILFVLQRLLTKVIYYLVGWEFERSEFAKVEQKKLAKRFNWFQMEEIVEPLRRIEKKLGIKRGKNERNNT